MSARLPIGLTLCGRPHRVSTYRFLVLALTFVAYSSYHLSRRPLSVVKNVLSRNCSQLDVPSDIVVTNSSNANWCDWKPFGGQDANALLGISLSCVMSDWSLTLAIIAGLLDSSFLFSYAFFMFFSGFVADRCHLRYFLALGMLMSGIFTYLFGIAFYYNIHSFYYFIIVQIICGKFTIICQTYS